MGGRAEGGAACARGRRDERRDVLRDVWVGLRLGGRVGGGRVGGRVGGGGGEERGGREEEEEWGWRLRSGARDVARIGFNLFIVFVSEGGEGG